MTYPELTWANGSSGGTPVSADALNRMEDGIAANDARINAIAATTGDQTSRLNTFLAASTPLGVKRLIGAFTVSGTLTIPANTYVDAMSATITTSVYAAKAITLGAGASLFGGVINSPSTWDGTNTGNVWVAAVVSIEGDGASVDKVVLNNVPTVGIGINNAEDASIKGNRIYGNYPVGQWTGVETNHFGIAVEPGAGRGGGHTISGNNVQSCVQGIFIGPLDHLTGVARTISITGNSFYGCWNHGAYGYGSGFTVTGNTFHRCQFAVALSGDHHTVTGNTLYTELTSGTDQRDIAGISIRDAIGCTIADNTITGVMASGNVVIDVRALTGTVCRDNHVHDNTIEVVGTSIGIRVGAGANTCDNNNVHDNTVRSIGNANLGCITLAPSATGFGNKIHHNTVIMLGNSHGIYVSNTDGTIVDHNYVRLEFDSGSAVTLGMVALANSATRTKVTGNEFRTIAAWGTNVTIRAVYEVDATVTATRCNRNDYVFDTTKATAVALLLQNNSGALIDEAGTGAPSLAAAVGSIWRRTDGGAATTLYVKESGTSTTGWVGK